MQKLTPKQQRFVEEYLVDLNATQAAVRAGYSPKTANVIGNQNLSKPLIADAIQKAQAERAERTGLTAAMVVTELMKIGFSDIRQALTPEGKLIDPKDWNDNLAGAISSLEVVRMPKPIKEGDDNSTPTEYVQTYKIKTWDKNSALEKLCKHLGIYADAGGMTATFTVNIGDNDAGLL